MCGKDHWETVAPSLSAEKTLPHLLTSFLVDVRWLSERFNLYEKGLVSMSQCALCSENDD